MNPRVLAPDRVKSKVKRYAELAGNTTVRIIG
jgi:hypothetical protein